MKSVATVPGFQGVPTVSSLEGTMDEIQGLVEQIRGLGIPCQLLRILNFEDRAGRDQFLAELWLRYFPDLSDAECQAPTLLQTVAFYERVLAELRRFVGNFSDVSGARRGFSGSPFPEEWIKRHFL